MIIISKGINNREEAKIRKRTKYDSIRYWNVQNKKKGRHYRKNNKTQSRNPRHKKKGKG